MGLWYIYGRFNTCHNYHGYNKLIMNKILFILLLPISMIGQTINCEVNIIKDGRIIDDTSTIVKIINFTEGFSYSIKVSDLILKLKSPCEYALTFSKPGHTTKQVFIMTADNIPNGDYMLDINVEMTEGDESSIISGLAWFDSAINCFRYKQSSVLVKDPRDE
jgi:hypothetical protein